MGQVTIEIPQRINRFYEVDDAELDRQILKNLEDFEKKTKSEDGRIYRHAEIF